MAGQIGFAFLLSSLAFLGLLDVEVEVEVEGRSAGGEKLGGASLLHLVMTYDRL